jgi:hypothetical protein
MPIASYHQQPLVKFVQKSCPFFSYCISLELCICFLFHMSSVSCSDNIHNLTALPSNIILWHACVLFSGTRCCSLLWYKGMFPLLNSNMFLSSIVLIYWYHPTANLYLSSPSYSHYCFFILSDYLYIHQLSLYL